MSKTDLDWLCEDAEEVKRLMRLVYEWSQGDEHSFPVQLALLTRTQWRAAAMIPQSVNQSRELMERKLAEYRQQTSALVKNLSDTADAKSEALAAVVATHTEAVNHAIAAIKNQLTGAEYVAESIRAELESGILVWKRAKADHEAERQKLEEARQELDSRISHRDWLWMGLVLLGMVGLGIAIGLRIAR